ncbi:MAG: hypothetical protein JWQ41_1648 [Variovorax sp.]|nr:hypothetical protein [Variovorax sp.]
MNRPLKRLATSVCAVAILAGAAGCASQRISSALVRYGVAPEKAECVGDALSDRLSVSQLQSLGRAARAYQSIDRSNVSLTLFDLARVAAELRDPVIPIEIVRAGVKCAVLPVGALFNPAY